MNPLTEEPTEGHNMQNQNSHDQIGQDLVRRSHQDNSHKAGGRWAALVDSARRALRGDDGQATAEYALVMLAAASLAGLLLAWATSTDAVGRLMDAVLDTLLSDIEQ